MRDLFSEVLSIVEDDVIWLNDAARHYGTIASRPGDAEKPTWDLLAAVYQERARFHQALAEKMRSQVQLTQPNISDEHSSA
jgi:hypothetical protein